MPVSKPATVFSWAASGTKATPSAGKIAAGFASPELPSDGEMNWMFGLIGDWLAYVDDQLPPGAPSAVGALMTTGANVDVGAAAPPTTGQFLRATDATHATWQSLPQSCASLRDEKARNTAAQTLTVNAWNVRELTVENDPDGIVTLSSNTFALGAGTWLITWSAPFYAGGSYDYRHQSRLYNVTDSTVAAWGSGGYVNTATVAVTPSIGSYAVTLTGSKTYRIEHHSPTNGSQGGYPTNISSPADNTECYTVVSIIKAKD